MLKKKQQLKIDNRILDEIFTLAKNNYINNHINFAIGSNEQSFIAKCYIEAILSKLNLDLEITFEERLPYESIEEN